MYGFNATNHLIEVCYFAIIEYLCILVVYYCYFAIIQYLRILVDANLLLLFCYYIPGC